MYGLESLFLYFSRRAQQEQIAAINARSAVAAAAHQKLSGLHAAEALLALAEQASAEPLGPRPSRDTRRLEVAA